MPGPGVSAQEHSVRIAGAIVRLDETVFGSLISSEPVDLVISSARYLLRTTAAGSGVWRRGWHYLAVSRGVVFYTATKSPLAIPQTIKVIEAEDIWLSFSGR